MTPNTISPTRLATRELILTTSRRLLKQYGHRRVSMDDIAQEAGLAKATLYLHFSGKSAIVRTMFEQCRQEIDERAAIAAEDPDVASALSGVVEAHIGTAIEWFGKGEHLRELKRLVLDDPDMFHLPPKIEMNERLSTILSRAIWLKKIQPLKPEAQMVLIELLEDCANGVKQRETINASIFSQCIRRAVPVLLNGLFKSAESPG